ncbi:MAG: hypothetical protein WC227_00660 [Patescibacteria group bacterium]|jgi:hypothetical protein
MAKEDSKKEKAEKKAPAPAKPSLDTKVDKPVFNWKSADFASQERSPLWYLVTTIIAIALGALLYFQTMWTGMVLVLVAYLYLFLTGLKPRILECAVYEKGIVVDNRVVDFQEMKDFWLIDGLVPKFYFTLSGKVANQIMMPAKNADVEKIREFLANHLPEESHGEGLTDRINRWIKF